MRKWSKLNKKVVDGTGQIRMELALQERLIWDTGYIVLVQTQNGSVLDMCYRRHKISLENGWAVAPWLREEMKHVTIKEKKKNIGGEKGKKKNGSP